MDENEMDTSSDSSLDGLDDESEAFIIHLVEMRTAWTEEVRTVGMDLRTKLQLSSREFHNFTDLFHACATVPLQKASTKVLDKMQELHEVSQELILMPEEAKEEQELLQLLREIDVVHKRYLLKKERMTSSLSVNMDQLANCLKDTRQRTAETKQKSDGIQAKVIAGFRTFGIKMEHGVIDKRLQIDFINLATDPGVDAGVVLDFDGDSVTHVKHWPKNSNVDALASQLRINRPDDLGQLTDFLMSTRDFLKEQG